MDIVVARCTTCGYQLDIDGDTQKGICKACGNSFIAKQAIEFNALEKYEAEQIVKLRLNLDRSVRIDDYDNIAYYSKEILKLIPNDYLSKYLDAYTSSKLKNPSSLYEFYKSLDEDTTKEQLEEVVYHIMKHGELRDEKLILSYLKSYAPDKTGEYQKYFELNLNKENYYAQVPRDVFVCHRSLNNDIAVQVVKKLENDGNTCWISSRNLRPNDNENYWENIEQAIKNCSVFLVVSSSDAMLSKDVQKEMTIARELGKKVIELKIDRAVHTTFFAHYFKGMKWINAYDNLLGSYDEVCKRVFEYLHVRKSDTPRNTEIQQTTNKTPNQTQNYNQSTSNQKVREVVYTKYTGKYQLAYKFDRRSGSRVTEHVTVYYDSRVAYALAFFPLGFYSLDKFYLKDYKRAWLYMFTLQLFFVGWFIDSQKYLKKIMYGMLVKKGISQDKTEALATRYSVLIQLAIVGLILIYSYTGQ